MLIKLKNAVTITISFFLKLDELLMSLEKEILSTYALSFFRFLN